MSRIREDLDSLDSNPAWYKFTRQDRTEFDLWCYYMYWHQDDEVMAMKVLWNDDFANFTIDKSGLDFMLHQQRRGAIKRAHVVFVDVSGRGEHTTVDYDTRP